MTDHVRYTVLAVALIAGVLVKLSPFTLIAVVAVNGALVGFALWYDRRHDREATHY